MSPRAGGGGEWRQWEGDAGTRRSPGMGTRGGGRDRAGVGARIRPSPGTGSWPPLPPPHPPPQKTTASGVALHPASAGHFLRHAGGWVVANLPHWHGGGVEGGLAVTWGSGSGLSPRPAFPRLVAQPGPWDLFSVPAAFPASSSRVASGPTVVSGVARSSPLSIPARPPLPVPSVGSPARRGSAGTHRPPRRGGARHLGLSGGSCEMSANILCGLLQQASRCRCWRASGNRSPAVTNGSGTAAAVPTRVPLAGWATPWHRWLRWDMELGWVEGIRVGSDAPPARGVTSASLQPY